MAGAQLSSVTALEHGLPTIFEVVAQESLISTLKPAVKHIFRVMAQKSPERFAFMYRYSDELYSILQLVLESYYLKHYSASFSENFYGLKRVSMPKVKRREETDKEETLLESTEKKEIHKPFAFLHLSRSERLRSLLFLVVVPYVKNRCDQMYEKMSSDQQNISRPQSDSLKVRLRQAFLAVYPVIHMVWKGTLFAYQMAYVFGKSFHHSPLLRFSGVLLQNLTQSDIESFSQMVDAPTLRQLLNERRLKELLLTLAVKSFSAVSLFLSTGLSVGIFFLQFLDWWYTRDHDAVSLLALPKPDCPKQRDISNLPKVVSICPLCNKMRTNDTVLAVTGYVFCYPCIFRYVKEKGCCPVTGYPATADHLVRLYLSDV